MRVLAPLIVALLAAPVAVGSVLLSAQAPQARWSKTLEAIDRVVATSTLPALVVAVTDRQQTLGVFAHGYEDIKSKRPVTKESLFEIGSISKSFTAIALMQLADEGRFNPDAPISAYLPWFTVKSSFGPITGHHLLTHTAGLPNYRADLASMPYAAYALRDFEPSYAPGAHFWYSNLGFQTLGYALERIEGAPYPSIIQRRVFDRAGMRSSAAVIDDRVRARLPVSYERWPFTGDYVEEPWFEYAAADGSIVATAADMAAYARVILNRGAAPQGRILSESAFARLTTPVLENYAYGLRVRAVDRDTEIAHSGAIAGFGSLLVARMTDGFGVVMLGSAGIDGALSQWIVNAMKATARDQPVPEFKPPPPVSMDSWAGTYAAGDGRALEFGVDSVDRSKLVLRRGGSPVALTRVGPDAFRAADEDPVGFPYAFERRDGKVVEVAHGSEWYTRGSYTGPASFDVPPEYLSFVGRYKNHNPEDGPIRVFIRGGSLMIAGGVNDGGRKLVRVAPAIFRPENPDYNPERYVFDAIVDGHALRMMVSGMPMYRVDALLQAPVAIGSAQIDVTLAALTVPGAKLPAGCRLQPPPSPPAPASTSVVPADKVVAAANARAFFPFPSNPWMGADRRFVVEARKRIDPFGVADGPPPMSAELAKMEAAWVANVREGYHAAYVSADVGIDVTAIRLDDPSLVTTTRTVVDTHARRDVSDRLILGAVVVVVSANSKTGCFDAVDSYIRALK